MSSDEGKDIIPYFPPLELPSGGYTSFEQLETMVLAFIDVYCCIRPFKIWRINMDQGYVLYSTKAGIARTIWLPTDKYPGEPYDHDGW